MNIIRNLKLYFRMEILGINFIFIKGKVCFYFFILKSLSTIIGRDFDTIIEKKINRRVIIINN